MPSLVLVMVAFSGILLALRVSFPYLGPFYLGLVLALVMDLPVSFLESRGWSRSLTSLVFATLTFLTLPLVVTIFILQLWKEIEGLSYVAELFSNSVQVYSKPFAEFLEALPLLDTGLGLQTLFKWAWAIPDLFIIWTITALSSYFFCRDRRILTNYVMRQLPDIKGLSPRQVYRDTSGALWRYVKVQLLLMLISTGLSMVFFVALDLPFALLSGFLVGFFDLCPVLGPGLVYLALALVQISMGNTFNALALGIGYLILLLLRQWQEPYLVSERLGLHPLTALVGLYVGFRLWGPLGAVVGPVLMVVLKALIPDH